MSQIDEVFDWIDSQQDKIVEFALELGNISSPRGHEQEASKYVYDWLDDHGFETRKQYVMGDRFNVIGSLSSASNLNGSSLIYNAHIDTAYGNPDEDKWVLPESHRIYENAWKQNDHLLGDDIVNDQGLLTAFLWGARAIEKSEVSLAGDLYLTSVVGEIGGSPIDEYEDHNVYSGTGIGSRRLVDGGVTADYAIVAESTDFAVVQMEAGLVWFKIKITGQAHYQPRLVLSDQDDIIQDHPGALPKAAKAVEILEEWAARYSRDNTIDFNHGTFRPSAGVGAIRSGNPHHPAKVPGIAAIYLDVRLPPGKRPNFVRKSIEEVLSRNGIKAEIEQYQYRRGYLANTEEISPIRSSLNRAHKAVRGDNTPSTSKSGVTSMWRDFNVFSEVGIPCVVYGPSRSMPDSVPLDDRPRGEAGFRITDLLDAAKIYAATAIQICNSIDSNEEFRSI